jgi:hypothetical protein
MQKVPYCFPIIGGRKVENLLANLEALDISLSHAQIEYLESILPFDPGFPNTMIVRCSFFRALICINSYNLKGDGKNYSSMLMAPVAVFEKRPQAEPIRPSKH